MQSWSPLSFDSDTNQKDSYLSTLTAFLAANPPGTLGNMTGVSSPEASDESSPSSSEGNNSSGTPANISSLAGGNSNSTGPTEKRKQSSGDSIDVAAPLKDRRNNSAKDDAHSHPHDEDDDDDQDDEPGKAKNGKTSDKRRAQNRQAQRAFRERKEKHLKELEDRVLSLEQNSTEKDSENSALKQLVERLQNENERLKVYESAFSFSYAKDVSNSSSMATAPQFGGPNKPPTPPLEDVPNLSSFGLAQFGVSGGLPSLTSSALTSAALNTSTSAFASPAFSFPQVSAPLSTTTSAPPSNVGSAFDNSLFFGSISAPSPASTTGDSTSGSSLNVSTPPDLSSDLFSAYRDPSSNTNVASGLSNSVDINGFPDFESLFGPGASSGIDENPLASFLASPSPPASNKSPQSLGQVQPNLPSPPSLPAVSSAPMNHNKVVTKGTCPLTNGESFSFDVDGLCSELQAKAVCREAAKAALQAAMTEDAKVVQEIYGKKTN